MWTFVALALYCAFSLTSSAHDDINSSLTFFGFDTQDASLVVNDAKFWQITGLSYNDDDDNGTFYAISAPVSDMEKSIFKLTFDFSNFAGVDTSSVLGAMDDPTGITMEQPDVNGGDLKAIDTESIAFFDATVYQGVVVVNEGSRVTDQTTEFMVYKVDGSYLDAAEYDRVTFEERGSYNATAETTHAEDATGLQEDGGFKAVSITEDYANIVYVAAQTLVQDLDECTDCVRLVVTPLSVDSDGNLTFGDDKHFRYDVHPETNDEAKVTVRDVTTINGLQTLLVLESYTDPVLDDFNMTNVRVRVYEVRLEDVVDDTTYYFDCFSLVNCSSTATPLESDLVVDFESDLSDINGIEYLHFEALTLGPMMSVLGVNTSLVDDCEDDSYSILAAAANVEEGYTHFAYFCYSTTATPEPTAVTSAPVPSPTDSADSPEAAIMYNISYVYYLLMIMLFKFVL